MIHNAHDPYLFATACGRVFRCRCCERVQVEFAAHSFPMDRAYFAKLDRCLKEAVISGLSDRWVRLQLHTDAGLANVPLRPHEVRQFQHLVSGARAMLRLEEELQAIAAGEHRGTVPDASPDA